MYKLIALGIQLCTLNPVFSLPPKAPTHTRIIDNFSGLGIDNETPRFGWWVDDPDRGEIQTAYQVIVADNDADLEKTETTGTLWNSGRVNSRQQYGITYAGKKLRCLTKYWWKVRTWDKAGQASPWSSPISFVTAFFDRSDWDLHASWIRHPQAISKDVDPLPIFRKTFAVDKPVKQAWLMISGLGQFNAFLNGVKVGDDVIDPAWTDYDKTVTYVMFDVTSGLRAGSNAIGVMLGNGWFANKGMRDFGPLKLLAQLHIDFTDGTDVNVVTDTTWKAKLSPFTVSMADGTESYDARLEVPGWDTPLIDDTQWDNAMVAVPPAGKLVVQSAPPVLSRKVFTPVRVRSPAAGVLVYDFGQNMNGQFMMRLRGPAGATVRIMPGEDTTAQGLALVGRTGGVLYTLKGGAPETWRMGFSTIGFRYLEFDSVSNDTSQKTKPSIIDTKAFFTYTGSVESGSFRASDDRYNRIYEMALNTLRSNLVSIHTDGPNYEKLGWQEVAWTLLPSSSYRLDLQNLFTKIVRDIREGQRTCGLSPDIVPNYWATPGTPPGDAYDDAPAWGASMFMVPWEIYEIYGDTKVLWDTYSNMKAYLAYLRSKETSAGLIIYGLGDWMAPGGRSVENVAGAIYVLDTRIMRDVAAVLDHADDRLLYAREYDRVRSAYNKAWYDPVRKLYHPVSQANLAIPLAFGIVPDGDEAAVAAALVDDIARPQETSGKGSYGGAGEFGPVLPYHISSGDIGTTFVWRALGDAEQANLVQTMITQDSTPGYMNMLDHGCTTIPENWNVTHTRSHNHDMYAGIFEWFYRSLAGISSLKPGYQEILIKPSPPRGLKSVSASCSTVRGIVSSSWSVEGRNFFHLKVEIPANTTAKVYIPAEGKGMVKEGGKPMAEASGITFLRMENGYAVLAVGSGVYSFDSIRER